VWAVFCRVVALSALFGCHAFTPPNVIAPSDGRIAYTGRFEPSSVGGDAGAPEGMRFAWAGSRIELRFSGSNLRMHLTDAPNEDRLRETDWFEVRIDGGYARVVHAREGARVYTLARGLGKGVHQAVIVKRTEPEVGTATLHGFLLDANRSLAAPPAPKQRHIEVVGDSLTTGYGGCSHAVRCQGEAAAENVELTYGAVAARELAAAYTVIAWSGKGLLRNFDPEQSETLPDVYERMIPTDPDSSPAPAAPAVDAVIVNLGTNDFFAGVPDSERFVTAYGELLARLRARYPKALLVLVVGPMLADDFPQPDARTLARTWISSVRDALRAQGDSAIELIEFWYGPKEGVGCDYHPNSKTQARLGHELALRLREWLSW
jgi:lysophospholipase L1-like esterase